MLKKENREDDQIGPPGSGSIIRLQSQKGSSFLLGVSSHEIDEESDLLAITMITMIGLDSRFHR
jgi:hypothetical protein